MSKSRFVGKKFKNIKKALDKLCFNSYNIKLHYICIFTFGGILRFFEVVLLKKHKILSRICLICTNNVLKNVETNIFPARR